VHPVSSGTPTVVGAASTPSGVLIPAARAGRTSWLHPVRQAANEPSHFEPEADYLEELIEEDRRRAKRRRIGWIAALVVFLLALTGAGMLAYSWTQTRYFVGADEDSVVIFQGVQQNIGPISLSTELEDTGILLADLPPYQRASVERTINARSLSDAMAIVDRLRAGSEAVIGETPAPTPPPTQTPTPTPTPTTGDDGGDAG
jgi:protein phosphatase